MVSVMSSNPTGGNFIFLRHLDAKFVQKCQKCQICVIYKNLDWSLWGVSHLGRAKLVNCNQILGHVADQDYIEFID